MTTTFGLAEKLAAGQSITIQALGDSTVYGAYDTAMSGWVGRLGVNFGKQFNATVKCQQYNVSGSYNAAVTLNTGSGSSQILVRNAGVPGWTTANVYSALNTMLNIPNPDLIIHGTGFNDINSGQTQGQFISYIQSLITGIKTKCPGVPIIITTENVASISRYNAAFTALANEIVGKSLPVTPPLLASTTISGVWLMDTRQAYGNVWQSSLMTDSLHPNAAGYQTQADWMHPLLTFGYAIVGTPVIISQTPLAPMTLNVPFDQTISAAGTPPITWSYDSLPDGILLNRATGLISGTPTIAKNYTFTLTATNSISHDSKSYSVSVIPLATPFNANGETKNKIKLSGLYYPVVSKIKLNGQFVKSVLRQ